MLGRYENFPKNIHGITSFETQNPTKETQKAILCTFHRLNKEAVDLSAVTPYLKQSCEVGFEFGVAEGYDFNFLDQKELDRCLEAVDETEMETLDFFFVVRYHNIRDDGNRVPLKFDYCVLRFVFDEGGLEMQIRHERGPQRVSLDDSAEFLVKQLNAELSERELMPLFLGSFKKISIQ